MSVFTEAQWKKFIGLLWNLVAALIRNIFTDSI